MHREPERRAVERVELVAAPDRGRGHDHAGRIERRALRDRGDQHRGTHALAEQVDRRVRVERADARALAQQIRDQHRDSRPAAGIGVRAEAALVVGVDRDAAARGIGAEGFEGAAVVVEAVDREDHRARRTFGQPVAPRQARRLERRRRRRAARHDAEGHDQERDPAGRRCAHPTGAAGAGSGRPSRLQSSSGRRPDWRSVRRVTARLRLASRRPVESAIRL